MSSDLLDRYIDAWLQHAHAGSPDGAAALERLLDLVTEDVKYEDVAFGLVFDGHDGIAKACAGAYRMSHDFSFALVSRQTDGNFFAFEYVGTGTITGRPMEFRTVAVGNFSSDGLVESHRDYWDRSAFLARLET
jgi:SnoaL-like domain